MKTIIVCIITLLLIGTAIGEDYQPLATGNFWSYLIDDGPLEMRVVGEPVPIHENQTYPIHHTISPENLGLINYWTSEEDGGVLLWGFWRDTWGFLYQPAIQVVDAPLYVGKTWSNTVDIYALPDTTFYMTIELSYTVHEDPELTVPAGAFPTFGIGEPQPDPGAKTFLDGRFTFSGEIKSDKRDLVDRWYSLGVGVVQEDLGSIYQLRTYTDHPVPVESSTWGSVKALYRGLD